MLDYFLSWSIFGIKSSPSSLNIQLIIRYLFSTGFKYRHLFQCSAMSQCPKLFYLYLKNSSVEKMLNKILCIFSVSCRILNIFLQISMGYYQTVPITALLQHHPFFLEYHVHLQLSTASVYL